MTESVEVQVKVVIIDSVTFHFRQDFTDMVLRTRLLSGMAQKLMNIADRFDIAVSFIPSIKLCDVVMNERGTCFSSEF